jgi:hypothetical protein
MSVETEEQLDVAHCVGLTAEDVACPKVFEFYWVEAREEETPL